MVTVMFKMCNRMLEHTGTIQYIAVLVLEGPIPVCDGIA